LKPDSSGGSTEPTDDARLTAEQVRKGLWPKTLEDLKWRPIVFAILAAGEAEHRRKKAKKK